MLMYDRLYMDFYYPFADTLIKHSKMVEFKKKN